MAKIDEKRLEIKDGEKDLVLYVSKAPATEAFDIALRYANALQKMDSSALQDCFYDMLKYVDIDLKDGRRVPLDNKEFINQHIKSADTLIKLQGELAGYNFGFFQKDEASDS